MVKACVFTAVGVGVVCGHDVMSGLHLCLNPQKDKRSRDRPEVPLKCLEQSLLREHPRSTRGGERGCVCLSSSNLCCRVWRISTPSQGPVRKQETQSANGSVSELRPLVAWSLSHCPRTEGGFPEGVCATEHSSSQHSSWEGKETGHGPRMPFVVMLS